MDARLQADYSNLTTHLFMQTNFFTKPTNHIKTVFRRVYKKTKVGNKKYSKWVLLTILLVCLGVVCTIKFLPVTTDESRQESPDPALKKTQGILTKQDPPFSTKTPRGESYDGKWTRVSPPERNPVYAFSDSIDGIRIIVSQQPLPKELRDQTATSTKTLAAGYSATEKLSVSGAVTYIGTSAKGPQSVIMTKDNLLILVKSSQRIPNTAWEKYLSDLR